MQYKNLFSIRREEREKICLFKSDNKTIRMEMTMGVVDFEYNADGEKNDNKRGKSWGT